MGSLADAYFSGPEQIVTLVSALILWGVLASIGALAGGRSDVPEAGPVLGWAVVAFVLTVFGVVLRLPLSYGAVLLFVLAPFAAYYAHRRDGRLFAEGTWRVVVLSLPLLFIAAAKMASEWDEFSHWLWSIRFLVETDGFPDAQNFVTGGSFPAYPYNWPFLGYLSSLIAGGFLENAGSLINILLLVTFGMVALRLLLMGAGQEEKGARGWTFCALAVMGGTLLNPTFVQKLALTVYSDVSTAVCVGVGGALGWLLLDALANGDKSKAKRLAWQFGMVMLVLVNIKQANLVLFVMLLGFTGLAGLRDPAIRFMSMVRLLPAVVIPPLVIYALWRYHVITQLPATAEMAVRSFDTWNTHILLDIFQRMLLVASKKGIYFGLMFIASGFALKALLRPRGTAFDRMAIIAGGSFIGYNAFLYFIYVSQFGENDALRVASYWRYNIHLGLLCVAFSAYGAGLLWRRRLAARFDIRKLAWLPVILVVAAPVVLVKKLRFDLQPPKPHLRAVSADLAKILPKDAKLFILDPKGTGESAVISKYHLDRGSTQFTGYMASLDRFTPKSVEDILVQVSSTHVLVHSVSDPLRQGMKIDLPGGASYLMEKSGYGWRILRTWPYPENHTP